METLEVLTLLKANKQLILDYKIDIGSYEDEMETESGDDDATTEESSVEESDDHTDTDDDAEITTDSDSEEEDDSLSQALE